MSIQRLNEIRKELESVGEGRLFGGESIQLPNTGPQIAPVKRVAIFAEAFLPKLDGVSKSAYLTLQYLEKTGREVMVFAPDFAPTQVSSSRVVPLRSFGMPFAPETRVGLMPNPGVGRLLDEFQPDLIHLFSPALLGVNGLVGGLNRKIPVIANYQTDLPGYTEHYGLNILGKGLRDWLRTLHNRSHLTLVPSQYTLRQLHDWGYRRLRIWGRGVDGGRFNPNHRSSEGRERLLNGRDPNSLSCLYVGRLAYEKRVDLLLEVAKLPGVALTIIGDGAMREELESLFTGTDTYFMGYQVGEDLSRAYASADVFTFTGPNETFGQVVQEAMASGLPSVVINEGGVAELVIQNKTGYTCSSDSQSFVNAVQRLRDFPELRRQMAINARQFAEQRPWETIMGQLEGYYTEAVALNERLNGLYRSPKPTRLALPPVIMPNLARWRSFPQHPDFNA